MKLAHFTHPNNQRYFHNVPFDRKISMHYKLSGKAELSMASCLYIYKFRFYFRYKTGEIGLMMSRTKLSKHILHKDIETKLEEVGQKKDLEK